MHKALIPSLILALVGSFAINAIFRQEPPFHAARAASLIAEI